MKQASKIQRLLDRFVELYMRQIEENAKTLGEVGEIISPKEQMEAYDDLKRQDIMELLQREGIEVLRYIQEMEKRKAQGVRHGF